MWLAPAALLAVIALQGLHVTRADGSDTADTAGTGEIKKGVVESVPELVEQRKTDDLNNENSESGKTSPIEKSPEELRETSQPLLHKERTKRSSESDSNTDDEVALKFGKLGLNKPKYIYSGNKKEGHNRVQAQISKESDNIDDDSNSSDKDKKDKKYKKEKNGSDSSDSSDSDESPDVTKQWTHRPPGTVPHWQGHQRRHFSNIRDRRDASDEEHNLHHTGPRRDSSDDSNDDDSNSDNKITLNYKHKSSFTEKKLKKSLDNSDDDSSSSVKDKKDKKYKKEKDDSDSSDSDESPGVTKQWTHRPPGTVPHWQGLQRRHVSHFRYRPSPPRPQGFNLPKAPKPHHRRESSSSEEDKAKNIMKEVKAGVDGLIKHDAGDKEKLKVLRSTKDSKETEQKTLIVLEENKCFNNECSGDKKHDEEVTGKKGQNVIGKFFTSIKEKIMGTDSGESDSESNSSSSESHIKKLKISPKRFD